MSLSDDLRENPIQLEQYIARYGGEGIYSLIRVGMKPNTLPTYVVPLIGGPDDAMAVDLLHWRGLSLMLTFDRKRAFLARTDPELDSKSVFPKRTGTEKCYKRKRTDDADNKSFETDDEFELIDFTSDSALDESEDEVAKEVFGETSLYSKALDLFQEIEGKGGKVPPSVRKCLLKIIYEIA